MKATGIVRRIDDLGRIVIPKELRRTLRIREGDPMEIFTEQGGELIFRKYSPIGEMSDYSDQLCEAIHRSTGFLAAVCDRDTVVAAAGPGRQAIANRRLGQALLRRLEDRERYCAAGRGLRLPITEGGTAIAGAAAPIFSEGELLGGVLLGADPEHGRWPADAELRLLEVAASFLGLQAAR